MPAFLISLILSILLTAFTAAPAAALTADQVIALRKAGVSNEIIQQMIDTEMAVQSRGGVGSYVVKQSGGAEVIVYEARSPRGVVEYPVPREAWQDGGVDRLGAALHIERRRPPMPAQEQARAASPKAPPGGAYALHISSYRTEAAAQKEARSLTGKGTQARVQAVDLKGKGRWYRVLVGHFPQKAQAQVQGESLKKQGKIPSFRVMPD